ncbi:delta(9)-fatty-acid desaturase fat-6-like isoform X1 [Dermatophagoides farinae]|uniref:delta(9)-fatty-acid desaturase fat-6-like isoform X1 n=1 Tax=Dermatophagoides farinae TaxID=6954 RepID=UPI003F64260A
MAININNQQSNHIDNHDNFNGNGSDMDQGYCHQQHHHRVSSSPLTIRKKLMTQSTHEIPTTTTKTTITTTTSENFLAKIDRSISSSIIMVENDDDDIVGDPKRNPILPSTSSVLQVDDNEQQSQQQHTITNLIIDQNNNKRSDSKIEQQQQQLQITIDDHQPVNNNSSNGQYQMIALNDGKHIDNDADNNLNNDDDGDDDKLGKATNNVNKKRFTLTIFGYRPEQIKWTNVLWLLFTHSLLVIGYVYVSLYPVKFFTVPWIALLGVAGGFGVSIGAHRLFAHRSFKARWLLRFGLVLVETLSMNGGCYSYARDHRCHHKFVDTNGDPKNAKRGFFFAHIGWWMLKKHPDVIRMGRKLNHKDLDDEPLIVWQKKLYFPLFLLVSVVGPTLIPIYLWNEDIVISFFMSAVLRTVVVVHHLFTVNSIAHIFGLRPYNRDIGPTESKITMYLSLGEGSHNYHHTFPYDYANCEKKWWEVFNPSTLFVDMCSMIGLAYDLKKPSDRVIKGVVSRVGDPRFYEKKLTVQKPMRKRIMHGATDWLIGTVVAGWAIYPPILFKIITGRPVIVF